MKKLLVGLIALGLTTQSFAQVIKTEQLSEVVVVATNYKYLNNANSGEVSSLPVELLERKVAAFNVKDSEMYQDEYDYYYVSFYIPDGKILAAYDKDGKIIRTIEKFKDINIPMEVKAAVLDKYPKWTITKDVYVVNYNDKSGAKKTYKLKLENGNETIRVKTDEFGNFL